MKDRCIVLPKLEDVRALVIAHQKEKRLRGDLWTEIDDIELTYLAIKKLFEDM